MNIATGGGTMLHELVHPMLHATFPKVPPWFNEGMASLFEQARWDDEGNLNGEVNWRLPGLQEAIATGELPPMSALMAADLATFYNEDPGCNYGQARYLTYYLQEHGLLNEALQALRTEPADTTAVGSVLGVSSVDAWEQEVWRAWVMELED
ncbi:MAG: hypothetical protein ACI8RZ_003573 [Myxococcota bacterium]|jgi:hypothetical protein